MENQDKKKFLAVAVGLVAAMTLGGLGNIAVHEGIYWVPFIANIAVYGGIFYNLFKKGKEEK